MKLLRYLLLEEAEWYEFWRPTSGLAGGTIGGLLILGILKIAGIW